MGGMVWKFPIQPHENPHAYLDAVVPQFFLMCGLKQPKKSSVQNLRNEVFHVCPGRRGLGACEKRTFAYCCARPLSADWRGETGWTIQTAAPSKKKQARNGFWVMQGIALGASSGPLPSRICQDVVRASIPKFFPPMAVADWQSCRTEDVRSEDVRSEHSSRA